MEPGLNPTLEKQAIGRDHRLGQKRNVEIIRLFVKGSIKTRISKFLETKYGVAYHGSTEGSEKEQDSDKVVDNVLEVVGNLASERPKNAMVTSEFDLLFGVQLESGAIDSIFMTDIAMPGVAFFAGLL